MSLQQAVDDREDEDIQIYERWQGWRAEYALKEVERTRSTRRIWAVILGAALVVALASIIWR